MPSHLPSSAPGAATAQYPEVANSGEMEGLTTAVTTPRIFPLFRDIRGPPLDPDATAISATRPATSPERSGSYGFAMIPVETAPLAAPAPPIAGLPIATTGSPAIAG